MIDFNNKTFVKLRLVETATYAKMMAPLFIEGEGIVAAYKGVRDGVVFTNKRIIAVNVQGMTGTKKDFTSLPYSKIQAYSVETAGVFDMEGELELWFSTLGKVRFEFLKGTDVTEICRLISKGTL